MAATMEYQTWAAEAACSSLDPDALFVRGAAQRQVRDVCFDCPVRRQCLSDVLDGRMSYGVWGGLTERERRAVLRRYPHVVSWHALLEEGKEPIALELLAARPPRLTRA